MTPPISFTPIPDTVCTVGESPTWDAARQALLWCDIPAAKIFELGIGPDEIGSGARRSWQFDGPVGSFGLCEAGDLVVACGKNLLRLDRESGRSTVLTRVEPEDAPTRLNDGKVGPDGAFWVGSMDTTPAKNPVGALYRIGAGALVERKIGGIITSNGLAWSPDGKWMFHADTRGPAIDRWRFDAATGAIGARRRLVLLSEAEGRPDGGAMDQAGIYWSAGVSAGRLNLFDRQGRLRRAHAFPVGTPTMPCFGGTDLRTLFVTSLRRADATGLEGSLYHARVTTPGVPVHRFAF